MICLNDDVVRKIWEISYAFFCSNIQGDPIEL